MEAVSSLKTWGEAFENYPVATTRKIEKQLRGNIIRDKDKLRALVGGNYRDLLATAEQIVALDIQTKSAEAQISNLRQSCKPIQYNETKRLENSKRQSLIAELNLLEKCVAVTATNLKQGALLLTAQLLVINRLLHRSVSDVGTPLKILETVRQRLASLRRQLLRRINARLIDPRSALQELIEAGCAYCLATSCSSAEAIRHFSHLRLDVIRQRASDVQEGTDNIKQAFLYYVKTLQTTKSLLGRQLPEALSRLQKQSILRDPKVANIRALELENLVQLVSPEIQDFTPYVKGIDGAAGEDVDEVLTSWSRSAFDLVVNGLRGVLDGLSDVQAVLDIRTTVFSDWLAVCFSVTAHAGVFQSLRHTFNRRVDALIERQASAFVDIGDQILGSLPPTPISSRLWTAEFVSMPVGKGASVFQQQLRARHLGLAGVLRSTMRSLGDWATSIRKIQTQIKEVQRTRWQDKIEEAEEDEETTTAAMIKALGQEDAEIFSTHLTASLANAVAEFEGMIRTAATQINDEDKNYESAVYLLRATRETEQRVELDFPDVKLGALQAIIPSLHEKLAAEVVKRLSTAMEIKRRPIFKSAAPASMPPYLPSPCAFRTLQQICTIMVDVGGIDTWNVTATAAVKKATKAKVFEDDRKQFYMQSEFDEYYLKAALRAQSDVEYEITNGASDHATKGAEYWVRTQLLFGLLA